MKGGRGSLSGANSHARWEVCEKCRLRILYVPAVGAHAHYRQAGPLPADTAAAVKIAEERVKAGQEVDRKDLDSKNIALQRAEDSLLAASWTKSATSKRRRNRRDILQDKKRFLHKGMLRARR